MAAVDRQLAAALKTGRVVIEGVSPEIDCGRFPIKRVIGEEVIVEADIFIEGHEALSCALLWRRKGNTRWNETAMEPLVNDRWRGSFAVSEQGRYQYTLLGWPDPFKHWRADLDKRLAAGQDVAIDLMIGAQIVEAVAGNAPAREAKRLLRASEIIRGDDREAALATARDSQLATAVSAFTTRENATRYNRELEVVVDRERARFSTWYEVFPRSTSAEPGRHGSFRDLERWLPRIAELGFDVLYLPPIHPIGRTFRKGRNNALEAGPEDVGSPWAIGGPEGGHKALHPELGTTDDFRRLVERAREFNIEVALDIAFQASPDHPYVSSHPEWFRTRPDGTIQYAENPPKKYQDIYPFDFESTDAAGLWQELRSVFGYWIDLGVRIFRVDNPHTKPFPFWEWLIGTLRQKHPDLIFLSEAFTRPKVMYRLAKLGFTQSYTYFAWRLHKHELIEYFTELTRGPAIDFFRPNLWPNTPDILTEQLQQGGRPAFLQRITLAATLGASYGIYGPAFETMEHVAREQGSEEYLNSEKYEIRHWDFEHRATISEFIARLNRIRRENPALQSDRSLRFLRIDNDQLIAYSKHTADRSNTIITIVNLDVTWTQGSWLELPLEQLGLAPDAPFRVHDLLTDQIFEWRGAWNFVELNPHHMPAHVLRVIRDPAEVPHG